MPLEVSSPLLLQYEFFVLWFAGTETISGPERALVVLGPPALQWYFPHPWVLPSDTLQIRIPSKSQESSLCSSILSGLLPSPQLRAILASLNCYLCLHNSESPLHSEVPLVALSPGETSLGSKWAPLIHFPSQGSRSCTACLSNV